MSTINIKGCIYYLDEVFSSLLCFNLWVYLKNRKNMVRSCLMLMCWRRLMYFAVVRQLRYWMTMHGVLIFFVELRKQKNWFVGLVLPQINLKLICYAQFYHMKMEKQTICLQFVSLFVISWLLFAMLRYVYMAYMYIVQMKIFLLLKILNICLQLHDIWLCVTFLIDLHFVLI